MHRKKSLKPKHVAREERLSQRVPGMVLQSTEGSPKDHAWVLRMCTHKTTDYQTAAQPCQLCALGAVHLTPSSTPSLPSLTLLSWKKKYCVLLNGREFRKQICLRTNWPRRATKVQSFFSYFGSWASFLDGQICRYNRRGSLEWKWHTEGGQSKLVRTGNKHLSNHTRRPAKKCHKSADIWLHWVAAPTWCLVSPVAWVLANWEPKMMFSSKESWLF